MRLRKHSAVPSCENSMIHCDQTESHSDNVNTMSFYGFVFLFLVVVNFLHANGGNYSVATTRNAWVGSLVCLCYQEQIYTKLWMVEGAVALNGGLHSRMVEGKIRSRIREQCE